jgi:hypothetical protein
MKNFCKDYIFSNFIYSTDLDVDRDSIIKDIYSIKDKTQSVQKTNHGGWQSPFIKNELETESFVSLKNKIKEAVDLVIDMEKLTNINYDLNYWININKTNDYNVMHRHGDLLLGAVYYPFVPNDGAKLIFHRTDGASAYYPDLFPINCRTNMLCIFTPHLYHSVSVNLSEQERISMAFNIS